MSYLFNQKKGLYTGQGIYWSGNVIYVGAGQIECGGVIYTLAADTSVGSMAGLSTATWYGILMSEATGALSYAPLGTGWTGYSISGNQINLFTGLYSAIKNYCVGVRSSVNYRVLGVFKSNASAQANLPSFIMTVRNKPRTAICCAHSATQSISANTSTILNYDSIVYDTLSEVTVGASWKVTFKTATTVIISPKTAVSQLIALTKNTTLSLYKNNALLHDLDSKSADNSIYSTAQIWSYKHSVPIEINPADYIDIRFINTSTSGTITVQGEAGLSSSMIYVREPETIL